MKRVKKTFGTCRLGGWRQRPVPATERGRESLYRIEAGARHWGPRTSRAKGVDAGRVGASAGIESVARRQDGSSRPLGVARLDCAVAPHHRSHRDRHCQVDQTCRNRASCLASISTRNNSVTRLPCSESSHGSGKLNISFLSPNHSASTKLRAVRPAAREPIFLRQAVARPRPERILAARPNEFKHLPAIVFQTQIPVDFYDKQVL